jgi:anaerobic selenocysteine-containing dehydrogenase
MPAETIRRLAAEFATTKPAALHCGYAPGRTAYGEQFHRAAYALAAITGNVGIVGGNSGVSNGATGRAGIKSLPAGTNPIDSKVSTPLLADLLARGKAGGYPADIKMIYSANGDLFNQAPNANKMAASLDGVELIVVQDHFLTPTARHADIVLPATTFWERNDVHTPWAGAGHYAIYMKQAIQPMYECRNDMDIFADLAARLRINDYHEKTEEQWLRELTADAVDDFDAFAENSVARFAPAPGRGGLRRPDPRSRHDEVHHALGQDRDLLDGAGRQTRSLRPGRDPADPDLDRPGDARREISADAVQPQVARPHPFDPRQPALAGAGRSRRRVDEHRRRRPARHRQRPEGPRLQRPRLDRPAGQGHATHRTGRGFDQGGGLVHAGRGRHRHERLRQRAGRRSVGAVWGDDVQYESR